MRRRIVVLGGVSMLAVLAGCDSSPTKAEILKKASGLKTSEELEKVLGPPAKFDKLGPLERWTYNARDGVVVFTIVAGRVALDETGDRQK
ncbi:MAG: hypothetical protein KF889_26895 [Alphaproteobacteria bacterium]|nr:hypothetical protein [Alphaproteobacteria bacterium]MCW5738620.1 hypothetical protein [Alphaproteobacteria bacterium]